MNCPNCNSYVEDNAVFCAGEFIDNGGNGFRMGGQIDVFVINRFVSDERRVFQMTADPDSFTKAFRHDGFRLHVDQLVFERGAACIDHKNFHSIDSFQLV